MAERRMFSKKITDSDAFIEMASSAQSLYFHLCQGADDDGFNNQIQQAMYKSHASIDDLKVLMTKRFVIRFESGICVIKHWWIHNTLRKDRYKPTNFQEEIQQLGLKDNLSYTLDREQFAWLPFGCQMVAPNKDNISTLLLKKDNTNKKNSTINEKSDIKNEKDNLEKGECKGEKEKTEKEREKERENTQPFTAESLKYDIDTFCSRFGVMLDSYNFRISQIDFKLLTERFEESEWLKTNVSSFKKVCDLYPKIISGFYKNYDKKPRKDKAFEKLQKMFAEAEEEEREQKEKLKEREDIKEND